VNYFYGFGFVLVRILPLFGMNAPRWVGVLAGNFVFGFWLGSLQQAPGSVNLRPYTT